MGFDGPFWAGALGTCPRWKTSWRLPFVWSVHAVEIPRDFAWPNGLVDEFLEKQTVWEIA